MHENWIVHGRLIKHRLLHAFGLRPKIDYAVVGEPTTIEGAKQLAEDDRHQFEHWALGLVGARASAKGKGADRGIDGQLSFQEGGIGSEHKRIFISVKSGGVKSGDIRDLRGVVEREKAVMGWFITLEPSSRPMRKEATDAGFYKTSWGNHPRIQILTVDELLEGKQFDCPPIRPTGTTFKLPRRVQREGDQGMLCFAEDDALSDDLKDS